MAILTTPLLSFKASKSIGKALTYRKLPRMHVVSSHAVPTDPHTPEQMAQRNLIGRAGMFWSTALLDQRIRESWSRYATRKRARTPGYQYFVKQTLSHPLTPETFYGTTVNRIISAPTWSYVWIYLEGINTRGLIPNGVTVKVWIAKKPGVYTVWRQPLTTSGHTNAYKAGVIDYPVFFMVTDINNVPMTGDIYVPYDFPP